MTDITINLGVGLPCKKFDEFEIGKRIWDITSLHYAYVKCPNNGGYKSRVIMLRLNVECEKFGGCGLTDTDEWDSIRLCYYFNHCRKKDSHAKCRKPWKKNGDEA